MELEKLSLPYLKEAFYHEESSDTLRKEIILEVRRRALEPGPPVGKCVYCKQPFLDIPYDHALIEGHVYSENGLKEVNITGICEWCFDEITKPKDDD